MEQQLFCSIGKIILEKERNENKLLIESIHLPITLLKQLLILLCAGYMSFKFLIKNPVRATMARASGVIKLSTAELFHFKQIKLSLSSFHAPADHQHIVAGPNSIKVFGAVATSLITLVLLINLEYNYGD